MCFAVKYTGPSGQSQEVYVGKNAQIPVYTVAGEIEAVRWGRQKTEPGKAYAHHCARLESINIGKWDWLAPKAVSLAVEGFADWGTDKQVHWHDVPQGKAIRGALVQDQGTLRVYVVTEPVPGHLAHWSKGGRWPRLVEAG